MLDGGPSRSNEDKMILPTFPPKNRKIISPHVLLLLSLMVSSLIFLISLIISGSLHFPPKNSIVIARVLYNHQQSPFYIKVVFRHTRKWFILLRE